MPEIQSYNACCRVRQNRAADAGLMRQVDIPNMIYKVKRDQVLVQVLNINAHDYRKKEMKDYKIAKRHIEVTVGESVRIVRELQEMSQNDLSRATGIPQSTISAIENNRVNLGVERAKQLAIFLKCHPAVLVFPGWDIHHENVA
jgi:DNA-binding XRE family transcriptional regulator